MEFAHPEKLKQGRTHRHAAAPPVGRRSTQTSVETEKASKMFGRGQKVSARRQKNHLPKTVPKME